MQLITRENGLESFKEIAPGQTLFLRVAPETGSALILAANGIIAIEQLFKTNIQKTEVNAAIIDKIIADYGQHQMVYHEAIARTIIAELGEEAYCFYNQHADHFNTMFHNTANVISFERVFCPNCDK